MTLKGVFIGSEIPRVIEDDVKDKYVTEQLSKCMKARDIEWGII